MEIVFHIEGWEWEKREFGWRSFWTVKTPSMNSWIVKYTGSVYSAQWDTMENLGKALADIRILTTDN